MSSLALYFKSIGKNVAGYDKTPSEITISLQQKSIEVHFEDSIDFISNESIIVHLE